MQQDNDQYTCRFSDKFKLRYSVILGLGLGLFFGVLGLTGGFSIAAFLFVFAFVITFFFLYITYNGAEELHLTREAVAMIVEAYPQPFVSINRTITIPYNKITQISIYRSIIDVLCGSYGIKITVSDINDISISGGTLAEGNTTKSRSMNLLTLADAQNLKKLVDEKRTGSN